MLKHSRASLSNHMIFWNCSCKSDVKAQWPAAGRTHFVVTSQLCILISCYFWETWKHNQNTNKEQASKQRELDHLDMCRGQIQQLFCFHNFPQQYHSFKLMRGQKIPTQTTLFPRVRHPNEWRLTITHPVTAGRFFIFLAFKTSAERHFVPIVTIPIELTVVIVFVFLLWLHLPECFSEIIKNHQTGRFEPLIWQG